MSLYGDFVSNARQCTFILGSCISFYPCLGFKIWSCSHSRSFLKIPFIAANYAAVLELDLLLCFLIR